MWRPLSLAGLLGRAHAAVVTRAVHGWDEMLFELNPTEATAVEQFGKIRAGRADYETRLKERRTPMQFTKRVSSKATDRNGRSLQGWLVQSLVITLITWFCGPTPSAGQATSTAVASPPAIVYVSNAGGGITEVNTANNSVIATAPFPNNANGVAITPDGRRMYATNRDVGQVTVFDARTNVPLKVIPVGSGANDNLGVAISPDGELVYVANQVSGTITVIATETNTIVQTIQTGVEPIWITFSPDGSRAYVSNQVSGTVSVIATASGAVVATIGGFSCPFHSKITHDGQTLLVSSQCDASLKFVDLSTNTVVKSIFVGDIPRGIALSPDGKTAYVANFGSNLIQVIDVASQTNLNTPITVGANPWGIAMTPVGKAYVANFGANTISVIDTSTNTATATLPSRGNPEDVTVSTKAQPRILNYSFQTIDPPGSVITFPESVNNRGQIAGTYQDAAGVQHGFLRQRDGSFVTIDPPDSVLTAAFGINDEGTVVGQWQASSGALHGFTHSPSGVYTSMDFPGASHTGLTGINAPGRIVGQYDLGDQTTTIGFLEAHGEFTSFEDPAAAPAQTQPYGINSQNFISGTYGDTAGNGHGFVRGPDAEFHNFDFPGAGFMLARQINDLGQIVGQYATNFPVHGFILKGSMTLDGSASPAHFLSFDYPDSQRSAARGINNSGQVVGFYFLRGDPVRHGFLATRIEVEDD